VVKVSAEDLAWLEDPGDLDGAARRWAARGPALVLLTDGGAALRIARPGRPVLHRETPRVAVADTVGAGDSLAAGLLTGLLAAGITSREALENLPDEQLIALVDDAALVAALNCTRVGADPPTRAELDAARAAR
jgi:fructokinase